MHVGARVMAHRIHRVLPSVSFIDEREGWAAGHCGLILHTVDGGESWSIQHMDQSEDRPLFGVHFFDAKHGVAVGLWSRVMLTTDGGARRDAVALPGPEGAKKSDLNLLTLFADARGRVYAAGERGMVLRSDDPGPVVDLPGDRLQGLLLDRTGGTRRHARRRRPARLALPQR